ncbi:SMP-30/gluconolactonase/LRE family protein [Litchfieldia alkalitelluris]|uniref:SMP-30/gluconolactonase/LRE family protein n=1 Tax=Litchfieldia alkalitelluris TaxID=304268 RepID=UPI0009964E29|nr:SMP-30/gluconolactonase/LRE family protein [Litchfieldia alkalitelluris]
MIGKPELVINEEATLGEGPFWDNKSNLLYWVDILEKRIYIYNPETKLNRQIQLESLVGAVVPRSKGGLILALEDGFHSMDPDSGKINKISDPESHLPANRFNDGKCDAYGRFWAGTMKKDDPINEGALYCLDTSLKAEKKLDNIGISNGLAWSPDNRYFYFIDTPTKKVVRYDYDLETGEIQNKIDIITIPKSQGMPDGMTIDSEGMLWIAHWGGARVSRWNPSTGEQVDSIVIPALNVTSCTFGGKELNELFITTARVGMNENELREYPLSGSVFKIKTEIKGMITNSFRG